MKPFPAVASGPCTGLDSCSVFRRRAVFSAVMLAVLVLAGCNGQTPEIAARTDDMPGKAAAIDNGPTIEKGMYFKPELTGFALHNEFDDDGNGDGINETHVRRYINSNGDTAFSMTTGDRLWAWSLDVREDDADIRKNFVIRDSNCDGVFDERYSLDAEFHVPACTLKDTAAARPAGI